MIQRKFLESNANLPCASITVAADAAFADGSLKPQFVNQTDEAHKGPLRYMALRALTTDITVVVHPLHNPAGEYESISLVAGELPWPCMFDDIRETGSSAIADLQSNLVVYPY